MIIVESLVAMLSYEGLEEQNLFPIRNRQVEVLVLPVCLLSVNKLQSSGVLSYHCRFSLRDCKSSSKWSEGWRAARFDRLYQDFNVVVCALPWKST